MSLSTRLARFYYSCGKKWFHLRNLDFFIKTKGLPSYSQYGQDLYVKYYYSKKVKKDCYFYVDIGANDGVTLSNSFFLEQSQDQLWKGILIEADPNVFQKCLENRKSDNTYKYNVALCNTDGKVDFLQIEGPLQMLSGIVEEYNPKHLEGIQNNIKQCGGKMEIIKMNGAKFATILAKHPEIQEIDYLSIDVEGGEMQILESIDFSAIKINLIGIEDNYPQDSGIKDFLHNRGFREICRLGRDRFFEAFKN